MLVDGSNLCRNAEGRKAILVTQASSQAPSIEPWIAPRRDRLTPLLALGAMNFGKRTPEKEAARIIDRAIERGVLFFDTAHAYNDGESERILGRALAKRREQLGVATKVGFGRTAGKPEGLARARVLAACDESLERLGTSYIDVYYLHVPDYATPLEETVEALAELVRAGKIRHIGVSNYASWQVLKIMSLCDKLGIERPVVSQVLYNLLIRQLDIEYFKFTREYPIHTTVYNALAGGLLSGRYDRAQAIPEGSRFDKNKFYQGRYWTDRFFDLVDSLRGVATEEGLSLVELSYAWLAGAKGVDSILVGPSTVEHLDAALDACNKTVSSEGRAKIDALYKAFLGTDTTYAR
jgi:aryl-alcohol dehydrogenase-like predicted oxidoreductase